MEEVGRHAISTLPTLVRPLLSFYEQTNRQHNLLITGYAPDVKAHVIHVLSVSSEWDAPRASAVVTSRRWWKIPDTPTATAACSQPLPDGGSVVAVGDAHGGVYVLRVALPRSTLDGECTAMFGENPETGDVSEYFEPAHSGSAVGPHGGRRVLALAVSHGSGDKPVLASADAMGRVVLSQPHSNHSSHSSFVVREGHDNSTKSVTALDVYGGNFVVTAGRECAPCTIDARAPAGNHAFAQCAPAPQALRPGPAGPRRVLSPEGRPELVLLGGGHGVVLAWDVRMAGRGPVAASLGSVPYGGGCVTDLTLDPGEFSGTSGIPACLASCAGGALTRAIAHADAVNLVPSAERGDRALLHESLPLVSVCAEPGAQSGGAFAVSQGECLCWLDVSSTTNG